MVGLDLERGSAKGTAAEARPRSALYANPILLALAELQSRLYKILEEDELAFYKQEYPDQYEFGSPAAFEILYRFSQCFGWEHHTLRYGPNTKDPTVIELGRRIGETLEGRNKFSGEAFRFSYDERVSLGEAVVRRVGEVTAVLHVFESIPLYQFEQELSDAQSHCIRARLSAARWRLLTRPIGLRPSRDENDWQLCRISL
jgi:hypothetical protein